MHGQGGEFLAVEPDRSGIGLQQSGQHVEEGGFAGAVRTDQAVQHVGMHIQVDVLRHDQRAEPLVQAANFQDRLGRRPGRPRRPRAAR